MTHTNLTINELVCIDAYAENGMKGYKIAQKIKRSPQKVYDVLNAIKSGKSVKDYYEQTQENMKRRGAKRKDLFDDDLSYVTDKVSQGWTPDVIIGRGERQLNMSSKTLYRRFIVESTLNGFNVGMLRYDETLVLPEIVSLLHSGNNVGHWGFRCINI